MDRTFGLAKAETMGGGISGMLPVDENLKRRLEEHRQICADLESAIKALEEQPKLLETLNLLRRVGI